LPQQEEEDTLGEPPHPQLAFSALWPLSPIFHRPLEAYFLQVVTPCQDIVGLFAATAMAGFNSLRAEAKLGPPPPPSATASLPPPQQRFYHQMMMAQSPYYQQMANETYENQEDLEMLQRCFFDDPSSVSP